MRRTRDARSAVYVTTSAATRPTARSATSAIVRRARSGTRSPGLLSRRGQSIPDPADRLDQWRAVGVELLPQIAHVRLHDVRLAPEVVVPDVIEDLRLLEHARSVLHQIPQQPELGDGELDGRARPPDLMRLVVQLEVGEDEFPVGGLGTRSPQERPDPGDQLLEAEGLRHVVVAAEREAPHLVLHRV